MYNVFQKDVLKVVLICISLSTPRGYIGMNEKNPTATKLCWSQKTHDVRSDLY